MKNPKYLPGLICLLFMGGILCFPTARARAQAAWQVLFNGSESQTEVLMTDSGPVVPVYFPVPEEGEVGSYGVLLETDVSSKQIKITRVKKKGPLIQRGDCPKCSGSKECQDCYPAGSGENTAGSECYNCNATGDCPFCNGSGDCYNCGGGGMPNGCNTCGDVGP